MKRMNFPGRKRKRRAEAEERQAKFTRLSNAEKESHQHGKARGKYI